MAVIERACLLALLACGTARAADVVEGALLIYSDDDDVTVVSRTIAGRYDGETVSAGARLAADVITAASVDLVTAASPGGYEETRREAETDVSVELDRGVRVGAGYGISVEPDFVSQRASANYAHEIYDRRLSLSASYAFTHSAFGRAQDPELTLERDSHAGEIGASLVLSPTLVVEALYGLTVVGGEQANPYRYVRLYAPGAAGQATAVPEAVPDERLRHVGTLRLRARLHPRLFGVAAYRLYADSWGVVAHTASLRASRGFFDEVVVLSADARGYLQDAAGFYRARYETFPSAPARRTSDKELGPMWTARGGLHVEVDPGLRFADALRIGAGFDLLYMRYLDFPFLDARRATLSTIDVTWEPR